jgi:putative oxidoreductase
MTLFRNFYRYRPEGLLLLRLGIGLMFFLHGWPKLVGGPEKWAAVGSAMSAFGITGGTVFFGFMAAFAETVGALCIFLGLFFRPATLLLLFTMLVATAKHYTAGDGFGGYSHPLEAAILFLSLFLIGPGRYSLDQTFFGERLRLPR